MPAGAVSIAQVAIHSCRFNVPALFVRQRLNRGDCVSCTDPAGCAPALSGLLGRPGSVLWAAGMKVVSTQAPDLVPATLCDGGPLDCNSGLLIAIRRALAGIEVGQLLEIRSQAPSVEEDLPAWCEIAHHQLEHVAHNDITVCYFVRRGR